MRGPLVTEAALHGMLTRVRGLARPLLEVRREQTYAARRISSGNPDEQATMFRKLGKGE
jgi:hypothetical protein